MATRWRLPWSREGYGGRYDDHDKGNYRDPNDDCEYGDHDDDRGFRGRGFTSASLRSNVIEGEVRSIPGGADPPLLLKRWRGAMAAASGAISTIMGADNDVGMGSRVLEEGDEILLSSAS
uniref:Uncharacterized protein n=1 Tax=Oryza glumipatula TaxID=40148 RepID=A0A0D9ZAX4_9ORYZ